MLKSVTRPLCSKSGAVSNVFWGWTSCSNLCHLGPLPPFEDKIPNPNPRCLIIRCRSVDLCITDYGVFSIRKAVLLSSSSHTQTKLLQISVPKPSGTFSHFGSAPLWKLKTEQGLDHCTLQLNAVMSEWSVHGMFKLIPANLVHRNALKEQSEFMDQ